MMLPINLSYGEIRALIKLPELTMVESSDSFPADAMFAQGIERIIEACDDNDHISPQKMLACYQWLNNHIAQLKSNTPSSHVTLFKEALNAAFQSTCQQMFDELSISCHAVVDDEDGLHHLTVVEWIGEIESLMGAKLMINALNASDALIGSFISEQDEDDFIFFIERIKFAKLNIDTFKSILKGLIARRDVYYVNAALQSFHQAQLNQALEDRLPGMSPTKLLGECLQALSINDFNSEDNPFEIAMLRKQKDSKEHGALYQSLMMSFFKLGQKSSIDWVMKHRPLLFQAAIASMSLQEKGDLFYPYLSKPLNMRDVKTLLPTFGLESLILGLLRYKDLDLLKTLCDDDQKAVIQAISANIEAIFVEAAIQGRVDVIKWIVTRNKVLKRAFEESQAGVKAFSSPNMDMEWLAGFFTDDCVRVFITQDHYAAFFSALNSKKNHMLKWLNENYKKEFDDFLQHDRCAAFRWCCEHLPFKKSILLLSLGGPVIGRQMLQADIKATTTLLTQLVLENKDKIVMNLIAGCEAAKGELVGELFKFAVLNSKNNIIQALLANAEYLEIIEANPGDEGEGIVFEYLTDAAYSLDDRKNELNYEDMQKAMVVIQALIRRNNELAHSLTWMLLEIPHIQDIAHSPSHSGGEPNALLRFAREMRNHSAIEDLMSIDGVVANALAQDDLRLLALSTHPESSMQELTESEKLSLAAAQAHYQPSIDAQGIERILDRFRKRIANYYLAHPATFKSEAGLVVSLPLFYEDFETMPLSNNDREQALKAYYKNVAHTAFRFISIPNLLLDPDATFVNWQNGDKSTGKGWSNFTKHLNLLGMVILAAEDTETPCVNDFTLKTKFKHLLRELAMINRLHNCDTEDYQDDLKGDKPSCSGGIVSRLFQSVPGNPRLNLIGVTLIREEVRCFALDYFKSKITEEAMPQVFTMLEEALYDENEAAIHQLKAYNITDEAIVEFKSLLADRYGDCYCLNEELVHLVTSLFHLDLTAENAGNHAHILTLSGLTNIYLYLDGEVARRKPPQASVSQQGLFSSAAQPAENEDSPQASHELPSPQ